MVFDGAMNKSSSPTIKVNLREVLLYNSIHKGHRIGISVQDFMRLLLTTYFSRSEAIVSLSREKLLLETAHQEVAEGNYTECSLRLSCGSIYEICRSMRIRLTRSLSVSLSKWSKGIVVSKKKVVKQLEVLLQNPHHPSLRLHKLESDSYWSISVDKSIRILITFSPQTIIIYHIGKHEDVY